MTVYVLYTWDKFTTEYVLRNTNAGFGIFNFHTWPENASDHEASVSLSKLLGDNAICLAKIKSTPFS